MARLGPLGEPEPRRQVSTPPPRNTKRRRGRFAVNLVSNVGGFAVHVLVGLWYTPFLIHHLGVAAFGIIPLATRVTEFLAVFTIVLNGAIARNLTVALERDDDEMANRYFNTSLFGSILLLLVLSIPVGWIALNADTLIQAPAGQADQVRWLVTCTGVVFLISLLRSPFGVSTYCLNRFDLRSGLQVTQRLLAVGVVVAFFSITTPQMWQVGVGLVAAALFGSVGVVWLWRSLTPSLRVSFSGFDWATLKDLTSFGGWLAINRIGAMLFVAVELIVVNRLIGPEAAGRYAAALQWSVLLRTLTATINAVFSPTIMALYARDAMDELMAYSRRAVKCVGILIALPIGLVCGLSEPLLETWLGPEFADLSALMTLLTLHLSVNLAMGPLFALQSATKRVRLPGLVTLGMGLTSLGLAVWLAGPVGWGIYGVAAAGVIMLTTKNLVFTPFYAAHIMGRKPTAFLWEIAPITATALLTVAAGKLLAFGFNLVGWGHLVVAGAAISIVYIPGAYFLLLTPAERSMVWRLVPGTKRTGGDHA